MTLEERGKAVEWHTTRSSTKGAEREKKKNTVQAVGEQYTYDIHENKIS